MEARRPVEADAEPADSLELGPPRPRPPPPESPAAASSPQLAPENLLLVVPALPEAHLLGYDCLSLVANRFLGLRQIPPGAHFVWATHPGGTASRSGFFFFASAARPLHAVAWNRQDELFAPLAGPDADARAHDLARSPLGLLPYRDPSAAATISASASGQLSASAAAANLDLWLRLSDSLTEPLLRRLTAQQQPGPCFFFQTSDTVLGARAPAAELELDRLLPRSDPPSCPLHFSLQQQDKTYARARTGPERTQDAIDTTNYLLSLLQGPAALAEGELIGELQLAYLVGVYLGNDACLQQWWFMVLAIFLKAYRLPLCRPRLAAHIFRLLASQLSHSQNWLETSILDHAESDSRRLRLGLVVYKRRLDDLLHPSDPASADLSPDTAAVGTAFARLEAVVADRGWDLSAGYLRTGNLMLDDGELVHLDMSELQDEDERGEWAPQLVQLDEHGRQLDLVSWSN